MSVKFVQVFFFLLVTVVIGDGDVLLCEWVEDQENLQLQCDNYTIYNVFPVGAIGSTQFWRDVGILFILVLVAGTTFGMAFGFVSLDRFIMKVKYLNKKHPYAKALFPLVKMHSQVVVTLLLTFVGALEAIPLLLNQLVNGPYLSLAISIPIVFLFGEIIPCSVCVRWTLTIGYFLRPFIWFLVYALFPVAWPIAKILDTINGPASYAITSRPALKELVHVYTEQQDDQKKGEPAKTNAITEEEVTIILGALHLKEKTTRDVMTHLDKVFMLSDEQVIDSDLIEELLRKGHSRIPIYHGLRDKKLIIGMALTTVILGNTITHKSHDRPYTVNDLEVLQIPCVSGSMSLVKLINQFRIGRTKMAVVLDENDNVTPVGIITSEDVFAALITIQLEDEYDLLLDQRRAENVRIKRSDSQSLLINAEYLRKPSMSVDNARKQSMVEKRVEFSSRQSSTLIPEYANLKEILSRKSQPGSAVFPPPYAKNKSFKEDNL